MRWLHFILFLFFYVLSNGQTVGDTSINLPLVTIHFGGQTPAGDMKDRFGNNLNVGGSFLYKTKSKWVLGLEGNYLFSKNVKDNVLSQMKNADGFIVDNEGLPADVRISERGFTSYIVTGRVFPKIAGSNQNCGLIINLGFGYMQHKVKLYDAQQKIAAIKGDLKKGYDRLSGGFVMHQFIGYVFLSSNRLVNFITGFEFYEGFTKSYRGFNYDTALPDNKQRFDMLIGFRIGWVLPLYSRGGTGTYYYN